VDTGNGKIMGVRLIVWTSFGENTSRKGGNSHEYFG